AQSFKKEKQKAVTIITQRNFAEVL
ncbi:MAG: hypothetical protein RL362_931, partial [Bacteroidota bacterium]